MKKNTSFPKIGTFKLSKKGQQQIDNIPYKNLIYSSVVINLLVVGFVILIRDSLPPEVPIFYGFPRGEFQIGSKFSLAYPNLTALTFILINALICVFTNDNFIKKTLIISSFVTTTLASITVVKIVFLIGSF